MAGRGRDAPLYSIEHASFQSSDLLISDLVLTDTKLGKGADASVYLVEWNGTVCAAKRLHEVLLEDESPGGTKKLVSNFEIECVTWSKLRHPGIVQFLGVYLERGSRLPVLVMEKMDTSLRQYLESHSKDRFPLELKAFVLHQITQALAYLHSQNPPLVHHDLSTNNVLLNVMLFMTKLTDFGMSRAINPSTISRKSSIKGTPAFMPPEALQTPLQYNEKLDIFSFGNVILSTITHEWPEPCYLTQCKGDQLIALDEFQRRKRYVEMFTAQEKQLFLPTVRRCLENRSDKRPSSAVLVQELRDITSALSHDGHVAAPIQQLRQQLSAKEEDCRQKDEVLRKNEEVIREKEEALRKKDDELTEKCSIIQALQNNIQKQQSLNRGQRSAMQQQQDTIRDQQAENERLRYELAVAEQGKPHLRDWRELGKFKVIQHSAEGGRYSGVAVNSEGLLAVTDSLSRCVHLLTDEGVLVRSIGKGELDGGLLSGVAFDLKGNAWVADYLSSKVVKLSQNGLLIQTINHTGSEGVKLRNPIGVSVSEDGLIYICDFGNHRITVHDEEGRFLFAFGSQGSGPGCFDRPGDITFGSDGLVYVTDERDSRVCVWSKDGHFQREFVTKYVPFYITATRDNHLSITSYSSNIVMVYTLKGELVHIFGEKGYRPGSFNGCKGICINNNTGRVYIADYFNKRVQVF